MALQFEWDPRKARSNLQKHSVSFDEALTIFRDARSITIHDPDHSESESRFLTLGLSEKGHCLVVSHTDRDGRIRIISARKAVPVERKRYAEKN